VRGTSWFCWPMLLLLLLVELLLLKRMLLRRWGGAFFFFLKEAEEVEVEGKASTQRVASPPISFFVSSLSLSRCSVSLNRTPLWRCRQPLRRAWRCVSDKRRLSGARLKWQSAVARCLRPGLAKSRKRKIVSKNLGQRRRGIKTSRRSSSPLFASCLQ